MESKNQNSNKKRRNSESDIYSLKIKQRSSYDEYFKNQNRNTQIDILDKEDEIYNSLENKIPLRYVIINSSLPINTKSLILSKIDIFENMSIEDNEYTKMYKWIDGLSKIPFDRYSTLPISLNENNSKIQNFLVNSFNFLKKSIYGQNKAKNKIMQILAQWISNPNSQGQVIALEGPAGVGKTSLIKNGVSKVLQRPFSFYALGGSADSSVLEGHSFTYEGSNWGKISDMLMESKVMNPIIFFDELDKISISDKGNDINGLLIHLTDYTQNSLFQDKYFSGINLDLSKSIFFFSYNDVNKINKILKDRLTIIRFDGYSIYEKMEIMKKYLINQILDNIGLKKNEVIINDDEIFYILKKYCDDEKGMRNSKRIFEELFLRINLLKLISNGKSNNVDKKLEIDYNIENLKFPLILNIKNIEILLKDYNL